jgi:hypothetical protein
MRVIKKNYHKNKKQNKKQKNYGAMQIYSSVVHSKEWLFLMTGSLKHKSLHRKVSVIPNKCLWVVGHGESRPDWSGQEEASVVEKLLALLVVCESVQEFDPHTINYAP